MVTLRLIRLVALWMAVLALFAQGAQAKLVQSESGTLTLPICTIDGTRFVTVDLDNEKPDQTAHITCDHCVIALGPLPETPHVCARFALSLDTQAPQITTGESKRSPIWPGAPPIGPPSRQG